MQEKRYKGIKAVIFDLDGTLIDSFQAIMEGFNAALPRFGRKMLTLSETRALVGRPLRETFSDLLGDEYADEATAIFRKRYKEVFLSMTSALPHAVETVKELHRSGYIIAVATNKFGQFSREIIEHLGMENFIATVIGDGDGVRKKPYPDMLIRILEDTSIRKGEAIFVGDSPIDMDTGKTAGVRTVAVPTGYHSGAMLKEAGAKVVIEDLSRLKEVLAC